MSDLWIWKGDLVAPTVIVTVGPWILSRISSSKQRVSAMKLTSWSRFSCFAQTLSHLLLFLSDAQETWKTRLERPYLVGLKWRRGPLKLWYRMKVCKGLSSWRIKHRGGISGGSGKVDEWRDGWKDEWRDGWRDGWRDECEEGWWKEEGKSRQSKNSVTYRWPNNFTDYLPQHITSHFLLSTQFNI